MSLPPPLSTCPFAVVDSHASLCSPSPLYSLPALGELFVNVTSYEIAYTRAPARMKGLVYGCVLFMSALSSALTLILDPVLVDPYLIVRSFLSSSPPSFFISSALLLTLTRIGRYLL